MNFAWAGGKERGEPHYYRVQGKTFLLEYDNVQNEANHVHSVWRDFDGDFGRDILGEHYKAEYSREVGGNSPSAALFRNLDPGHWIQASLQTGENAISRA